MALAVKDSFLQREKTILVAIDVTGRKIEKLSLISTLCHHFSAIRSSRNCRCLEKLSSALGKEAAGILGELVSCQKNYNQLRDQNVDKGFHGLSEQVTRKDAKSNLIRRLKLSPEKRKFLKDVMTKAKILLDQNPDIVGSELITVKKNDMPIPSSVVGLLRTALKSKYGLHVRRCFNELDVESLMNILYLIMPPTSSSAEHSVSYNFMTDVDKISPFSSITVIDPVMGEQIESRYYVESPLSSNGSSQSFFWDDEETVINFAEELEEDVERDCYSQRKLEDQKASMEKTRENNDILRSMEMRQKFRNSLLLRASSSFNDALSSYFHNERQDYFYELEVLDSYEKFANAVSILTLKTVSKILSDCMNMGNSSIDDEKGKCNGVRNLTQVFLLLRSLVVSLFTIGKCAPVTKQSYHRKTIDLQLLTIEKEKLTTKLNNVVETESEKQEQLSALIVEWKCKVDEARCDTGQQLRDLIKDHVATEMSIEKNRKDELASLKGDLASANDSLSQTIVFVKKTVKSLRARRHYLEASLESLKRHYDATMLKYQARIDELSVEEVANNRIIEGLQNKFKVVEENYDEMRAMKRLKQLLQNMEKAESIKQNWAARKIQVAWRKYKVAKLRKKKLKGRKKGKKKTPPPGKGNSPPTKASTPGSRSKSQTP